MNDAIITLAHGGGGTRTQSIIRDILLRHLGNPILHKLDDGACLTIAETDLVVSTDSYVVSPIFFPGGDIGKLAMCGTINDLAMQGSEPRYMSVGLILEEGFAIPELEKIIKSMAQVSQDTGVWVVTGDTKVVERGKGNGVFINTTGIGVRRPEVDVHVSNARTGDVVIVTGSIGDHGIAVMSQREGLKFETSLISDVAPLWDLSRSVLDHLPTIHCLRDPTRGGVAGALCDIAESAKVGIRIREASLPIKREVGGACSLLGLDPLNVANEGKALIVCAKADSARVLEIVRSHPLGHESEIIGCIVSDHPGLCLLETNMGGERIVDMPEGEDLPRIC